MDFSTTYMGLKLRTPLVPSASPLSESVENIQRMERAGASAVVLHSLFEEQLLFGPEAFHSYFIHGFKKRSDSFSEGKAQLKHYLDHIDRAKKAVRIPIIASLNGSTMGGWTHYAHLIEGAGADALELNICSFPTDMNLPAEKIEQECLDILMAVKEVVTIPVAVKLSPYFSNMANMAAKLDESGANGLVLFNRFYQPDIELETQGVYPHALLSTPQAMRLPFWWISVLHDRLNASLAASGGIQNGLSALKMIMAGADVVMLCSILLQKGIPFLRQIEQEMRGWMEEHEFDSLNQLRGAMSQKNCPHPESLGRENYLKVIRSCQAAEMQSEFGQTA